MTSTQTPTPPPDHGRAFYLVYPEKRWISFYELESWFADAYTDNIVSRNEMSVAPTADEMASAMEDAGLITRGSPP